MATIVVAAGGGNSNATGTYVGGVLPTNADDLQLTNTSGNFTINAALACRSLDAVTGGTYTGTLTHNSSQTISIGDATAGANNVALKLSPSMTYTVGSATLSVINFVSTSATQQTVDFAGITGPSVSYTGLGGNWVLASAVNNPASPFQPQAGTLDTAAYNLNILSWNGSSSNVRTHNINGSSITLNGTGTVWNYSTSTNSTINGASSSVIVANTSASTKTVHGGGKSFGSLTINAAPGNGTVTMVGNNTWAGTTTYQPNANVLLTSGSVQTSTFNLVGTAGNPITIGATSTTVGKLTQNGGSVVADWLVLSYVQGQGTARWWAGDNSVDNGNNLGWTFSDPVLSSAPGLMMGVG
jgi:hypothetical protein